VEFHGHIFYKFSYILKFHLDIMMSLVIKTNSQICLLQKKWYVGKSLTKINHNIAVTIVFTDKLK